MLALEARANAAFGPNLFYGPLTGDLFGLDEVGHLARARARANGLGETSSGLGQGGLVAGGILGSLIAGGLTTLVFAWAFHARDPGRPKWKPALSHRRRRGRWWALAYDARGDTSLGVDMLTMHRTKNGVNGVGRANGRRGFQAAAEDGPWLVYGTSSLGQEAEPEPEGFSPGLTALLVTVGTVFGLAAGFGLGYVARGPKRAEE